jgi:outer membrane receptor for Fe3+-dicitrate
VKLLWAAPRQGWRANFRGQILGETPPSTDDGSDQRAYHVWSGQVSKRLVPHMRHSLSALLQVSNLFDKRDIFRRLTDGSPVAGDFIVRSRRARSRPA